MAFFVSAEQRARSAFFETYQSTALEALADPRVVTALGHTSAAALREQVAAAFLPNFRGGVAVAPRRSLKQDYLPTAIVPLTDAEMADYPAITAALRVDRDLIELPEEHFFEGVGGTIDTEEWLVRKAAYLDALAQVAPETSAIPEPDTNPTFATTSTTSSIHTIGSGRYIKTSRPVQCVNIDQHLTRADMLDTRMHEEAHGKHLTQFAHLSGTPSGNTWSEFRGYGQQLTVARALELPLDPMALRVEEIRLANTTAEHPYLVTSDAWKAMRELGAIHA